MAPVMMIFLVIAFMVPAQISISQRIPAFVSWVGEEKVAINVILIANAPIKIPMHAFFQMNAIVNQIQWIQMDCVFTKI